MTKSPNEPALLPCTFCGKPPHIWNRDAILPWVIQCCSSMVSSDKKALIEAWNSRTHAPEEAPGGDAETVVRGILESYIKSAFDKEASASYILDCMMRQLRPYLTKPAGKSDSPKANAEMREALKLAWELSTWTACIDWHGGENQKEWLSELREKIEAFQDSYKAAMDGYGKGMNMHVSLSGAAGEGL